MAFLPKLLSILVLLLPPGSQGTSDSLLPFHSVVQRTVWGYEPAELLGFPTHLPSPLESFFERLDDPALDEEDPPVEDHEILPLTFLDNTTPQPRDFISSYHLAHLHHQHLVISPILRC
jgi:hypothetical protein